MQHGIFSKKFHKQMDFSFKIGDLPSDSQYWPEEWKEINSKAYPRMPKVDLPKNFSELGEFKKVLHSRRSARVFNINAELSQKELSTLIYFSAGIKTQESGADKNTIRRFYPSGGARYPLEIYLGIQRVVGIEPGIYHYNMKEHLLERLLEIQGLNELKSALYYPWSRDASVIFIITAVWDRNFIKYKDRGYRIVLMETGHLMQNLALTAAALDIGCCNLVGFHNEQINEILDINRENDESSLYISALGK